MCSSQWEDESEKLQEEKNSLSLPLSSLISYEFSLVYFCLLPMSISKWHTKNKKSKVYQIY